jgi:hypothetical protein
MMRTRGELAIFWLAALGCQTRGVTTTVDAGTTTREAPAVSQRIAPAASSAPVDGLGTVYPRDLPPHPLATRLCETLHAVPARRKAECCGGEPAPYLAKECARVLGATLHMKTADLDEAAVERCTAAVVPSLEGCDWVVPSPPSAPGACQGLLKGKLASGTVCRSSLECEGQLHCEGVSPTKTGVCTPPGGTGAGCGAHVDVLATYLLDRELDTSHPFCADFCSLVTHKCGPQPTAGSACAASVNCAPSQTCVNGRCSAAPMPGEGDPCGAVPCATGLRCTAKVCTPLARAGSACASDADCAMGGCVRAADGGFICGAKCTPSLDALRGRDGGTTMRLPARPRADGNKR